MERESSRAEINGRVEADLASFASRALMTTNPPAVKSCGDTRDSAEYRRPSGDSVVVQAKLTCKGLVVVSDTFFPGWKAEIDGRPAEIYEVNAAMRGVVVPAGEHTLSMRYRPQSFYLGALLTVIGLGAVVGARFV